MTRHERTLHAAEHAEVLSRAQNSRPETATTKPITTSVEADNPNEQSQDPIPENFPSPASARSSRHSSDDVESDSATTVSDGNIDCAPVSDIQCSTQDQFSVVEPAPDASRPLPGCIMGDTPQFSMTRPMDDFWDYNSATFDDVNMVDPGAMEATQGTIPNQEIHNNQLLSPGQQQTAHNPQSNIPLEFSSSLGLGSGSMSAYGMLNNQTVPDLDLSMWLGSAPPQDLRQDQGLSSNSREQSNVASNAHRDNLPVWENHIPGPAFAPC